MASLAQRTPVAAIPEEPLVTTIGDDVIYHHCLRVLPLFLAQTLQ